MIELLSRLDPATSPFIATMIDTAPKARKIEPDEDGAPARPARCQTCRGRKRVKLPAIADVPARWAECKACDGSGRIRQDALGVATRSRRAPEMLTTEQIGYSAAGMEPRIYRAAVTLVTHDERVAGVLVEDVVAELLATRAESWGLTPEMQRARVLGVARVAVASLFVPGGGPLPMLRGAELMCVRVVTYRKGWRRIGSETADEVRGWTVAAGAHMRDRLVGADLIAA